MLSLPPLTFAPTISLPPAPDLPACERLWDKYGMMPHIREHCRAVAALAVEIARRANSACAAEQLSSESLLHPVNEEDARAAALLHDLAKTHTIRHGGSHAQLGAAWVRDETGRPDLAQAVLFHAGWPWETGILARDLDPLRLPLVVSYADKRVRHAGVVCLDERYEDLLDRYGSTEERRTSILCDLERAKQYEKLLFSLVGEL